jgi:hypothetical protein
MEQAKVKRKWLNKNIEIKICKKIIIKIQGRLDKKY